MPLIYPSQSNQQEQQSNSVNSAIRTRNLLPRTYSRYNLDTQGYESTSIFRPLLQRQQREYIIDNIESNSSDNNQDGTGSSSSSSSSDSSSMNEEQDDDENIVLTTTTTNIIINEEEEDEEEDDDNTTITESFTRSRVDIYRLAIRTNSEILEDLAAIIRILRQINAIYRVFHNSTTNNRYGNSLTTNRRSLSAVSTTFGPTRRRMRSSSISNYYYGPRSLLHNNNDDNNNLSHNVSSDTEEEEEEEEEIEITSDDEDDDDEEANKLLEAGLEDLQTVLTMENSVGVKRQSTLALLALITYQYNHCSDNYLRHYLDPNGEYNPMLAIFAAATYDEDQDAIKNQPPKSCKDIMAAAEELYGPNWLDEFHKGKEGALRKMLEKLTFVAQIRLKVRDISSSSIIR